VTAAYGPEHILGIGFAFRSSKALLTAVELGLFSALAEGPVDSAALARRLRLNGRGSRDFFDALVALGLLCRDALGRYANTPDAQIYLDRRQATYIGGLLEYLNDRQYRSWEFLTQALREGAAQCGPSAPGGFAAFYEDPASFEIFMKGMAGGILLPATALAANFPWHRYGTFADIGCAQGCMAVEIAHRHPHLKGIGFDLPQVAAAFTSYTQERGLAERLAFRPGDFLADPLPNTDALIMARILHDWDVTTRKLLLEKAYEAILPGGVLIVCETLIDDERRIQSHALLSSLNMLLQTSGGSECTAAQYAEWMRAAAFGDTRILPLAGPYSAVIGVKKSRGVTGPGVA
jgi:precorrin-6B methylase 2